MCYGAYCSNYGEGAVGVGLIYDNPSRGDRDARRDRACGNVVCSDDESCDEYPFASTSDSDIDDRYARCVPAEPFDENHSQGGTLSRFYRTITPPQSFIVTFGNPGGTRYCGYPPDCANDGDREFRNGEVAGLPTIPPARRVKRAPSHHYYRAESGMEILSFAKLPIGKRLFSTSPNETMAAENERLGKRDPLTEHQREDEVIAEYLYSL